MAILAPYSRLSGAGGPNKASAHDIRALGFGSSGAASDYDIRIQDLTCRRRCIARTRYFLPHLAASRLAAAKHPYHTRSKGELSMASSGDFWHPPAFWIWTWQGFWVAREAPMEHKESQGRTDAAVGFRGLGRTPGLVCPLWCQSGGTRRWSSSNQFKMTLIWTGSDSSPTGFTMMKRWPFESKS